MRMLYFVILTLALFQPAIVTASYITHVQTQPPGALTKFVLAGNLFILAVVIARKLA